MDNIREIQVDIRPKSSILAKYRDYGYKIETTFKELIDNSSQSFLTKQNREQLFDKFNQEYCTIKIEISNDEISIHDDAFGMNESDFRRALKLDSPPEDTSGRNEKGMGLKTSASWLGNLWSVETTMYGSNKKYYAEIDVKEIEAEAPETILAKVFEEEIDRHYTIIRIRDLNQKIGARKVDTLINKITEIFSRDIKNKDLKIIINGNKLIYEEPILRKNENGDDYLDFFDDEIEYDGKKYSFEGWLGIRETANVNSSGFTLIQKGRAIQTNYRPSALLGQANGYPYQRIIGEIVFSDTWKVTHTKDSFLWDAGLEEEFILKLKKIECIKKLIKLSSELRSTAKVSNTTKQKIIKNVTQSFQALQNINSEEIVHENLSDEVHKTDFVITTDSYDSFKVPYGNKNYIFTIKIVKNILGDWLKISKNYEEELSYIIEIDNSLSFFRDFLDNAKENLFLTKFITAFTLSIIESGANGVKEASKIITILNNIIKNVGENSDNNSGKK